MIQEKSKECYTCPLFNLGTGFLSPEGQGLNGVLILGEAAGENEAQDSLPFRPYAQAGSILERCINRAGLRREEFVIYNMVNCFVSPKTSIYTAGGNRQLTKLQPGDLVLTHKLRYRPVVQVIRNLGEVDVLNVTLTGGDYYSRADNRTKSSFSRVTVDHKFLTPTGWRAAGELQVGNKLLVLAEHCLECSKAFYRHYASYEKRMSFCSVRCHNKFVARGAAQKIQEIMLESYHSGQRDPYVVTKAAQEAFRQLLKSGWRPSDYATEEGRQSQRVKCALTREAKGLQAGNVPWIGHGERELAAMFEAADIDYTSQYALAGFNFDFKVGDTLIEVDGASSSNFGSQINRAIKETIAEQEGLRVVHVPAKDVGQALAVVQNDTHDYSTVEATVTQLDLHKWDRGTWTLQVEDDESYVGQGTISHNCKPPGNKLEGQAYEARAVSSCTTHVRRVIEQYRPKVILALGGVACKWLTGMSGAKKTISLLRGFVYDSSYGIPVVPSLHPAFIARGKSAYIPVLIRDLLYAVEIAKHGPPVDVKNYQEHPSTEDCHKYLKFLRANPSLPVSYDIETDYSLREPDEQEIRNKGRNIEQIQFSHEPHQGIALPWVGEYIEIAKEILALPNPKWGFNCYSFDQPILEEHNVRIHGEHHDIMLAWHHLQPDLPKGLQFVTSFYAPEVRAWKHLSEAQPQFYGCIDVDAVSRIGQRIFKDLDKAGVRRGYDEHIYRLFPILRKMCERGFPVDLKARDEFRAKIAETSDTIFREVQSAVSGLALRPIHPKEGYKNPPPAVRETARQLGTRVGKNCDATLPEDLKKTVKALYGLECKRFADGNERFFRLKDFLPGSDLQLKQYIRAKGHKMPHKLGVKDEFGRPKETTEKKGLERLYKQTRDDFYRKVIEYRELSKIISTYVDGWKPDAQGRVHSEFTFAPATGQLSSRNPNIQNIPKGSALAYEFRKIIRPRQGCVLVAFDYSAFHVLTLGFEAKCADYMRLARLDIHSFLAGHLLKLEDRDMWLQLSNEDLGRRLGEIKHDHETVRNKKSKPGILGYGLGLQANKLYDMNLESFKSKKEAQGVINMLNHLFPKVAQFREDIKALASQQGYLLSKHGSIRRFNDIYGYRQVSDNYEPAFGEVLKLGRNGRRYKRYSGEEGESAIAQLVQNDAHGHIKDAIICNEKLGYNERYGFINTIHDELIFECPEILLDECLENVAKELERPSTLLVDPTVCPGGLACGIEASIGRESWADMERVYKTPISALLAS